MHVLFKNIPNFLFAAAAILCFVLFQACRLLDVHYPAGSTQLITAVLFLSLWFRYGRRMRFPPFYGQILFVMALFLAAASRFTKGSPGIYALGTLFTFFFVLIFLAAYNAELETEKVLDFFKILYVIIPFLSLATILDVLANQVAFREAFTLFREPGASAGILIYGVILSLTLFTIFKSRNYLFFSFLMSLVSSISTYKKSMITLGVVWALFLLMERHWSRKMFYVYLFGAAALLGFCLAGDKIMSNIQSDLSFYAHKTDEVPRAVLLSTAYSISIRQFPFGSGMGTFASIPSTKFYSETYYDYGINKSWGMGPKSEGTEAFFLLDCYWAHILGELGFLGSAVFLGLWFYPAARVRSIARQTETDLERGLKFFIYAMTAVITVDGLGYYYAENPAFIIIHAGLMGMALRLLELSRLGSLESEPDEADPLKAAL